MSTSEETRDRREREMLIIMTKLQASMITVQGDVNEIKHNMKNQYVTKDQFIPVRNLVYSAVGIILSAVFLSIIALVLGVF